MNILSGVFDFFGLDLGTTAIRVVQLRGSGSANTLDKYGALPTDGNVTVSDSKEDRAKTAQLIKEIVGKAGIRTNNVVANLPSSRVFTTVIDLDKLPKDEMTKTINYQAESFIPTPLNKSKIDWAVIGDSPKDAKKSEVLLSSVPNDYIEARLDMLESVGFNVIAFEPDTMALVRALAPHNTASPQMVLDIGHGSTDLVIAINGVPRLSRSIPIGTRALVGSVVQALSIQQGEAEQFVFKFGVAKDKLEGKIYNALIGTVENLMAEVEKSIKFFQDRYPSAKIERIILTGGASALPELPLFIANNSGINVEIGNAWLNVSYPTSRQNELLAISNHFAVAVGLAERTI